MSFLERAAWIVVVTTLGVFGSYFAWLGLRALAGASPFAPETVVVLIGVTVAYVVLLTVVLVVAGIIDRKGASEGFDERDKLVEMRAAQPTSFLLGCGVLVACVAAYAHINPIMIGHGLLALQVIATLLEFGARIRFYRLAI